MGRYFGTDGIRGVVNESLDAIVAYRAGAAAATTLIEISGRTPLIVIGKDTRISSDMLESALVAGICSAGGNVMPLGVLPTPAVAHLTVTLSADMGIVISASHNSFEHNGIKMFNSQGFKLPDETEARIEELIDSPETAHKKTHGDIGRVINDDGRGAEIYIAYLLSLSEGGLDDIHVAVDCANGAASETAARLFSKLGVRFELISDHPNGVNINDGCGSTHMERLSAIVKAGDFDLGIAFDGDADRCLAVDENGDFVDGDKIMGICARAMMQEGRLLNDSMVATVMSNLGLHEYSNKEGINLLCAAVGDRNVLEMMHQEGCNIGGEQSGHLIFLDEMTTGDGQLAAVKLLGYLAKSGRKLSELCADIPQYPQVLINVPITGGNEAKDAVMNDKRLQTAVVQAQESLGGDGRVLVRPSGTEALIRVMVEAKTSIMAQNTAESLVDLIKLL